MRSMTLCGVEYTVLEELYRTRGSVNQVLTSDVTTQNIEERRRFYIVENNGVKYFVKEYTDKNYGGKLGYPKNIEYEFETTTKLYGKITRRNGEIDVPKAIDREGNRIMFEYLDGYRKPTPSDIRSMEPLIYEWLRKKPVYNYDLCRNNTLIMPWNFRDGVQRIKMRMIDFECSEDRDPKKEYGIE